MRYGLKLSQRASVSEYRAVWRIADEAGFDHCWNMDHFATLGGDPQGDIFEAWTLLATMAEATSRVRVGCMVTGVTYRHPAVLAKMAVTVDHLSEGRLEFGLGASWAENEHDMLGIPLGTRGERLDRFEEACEVILSLWDKPRVSFSGEHYRLTDAVAEPKPLQRPNPPIWIGGSGRKRTLRIAARHADAWNMAGGSIEEFAELSAVLDRHCADVGRDPKEISRTVQIRIPDDPSQVIGVAEDYGAVGADDIILITIGGMAEAQAQQMAELLPKLKTI